MIFCASTRSIILFNFLSHNKWRPLEWLHLSDMSYEIKNDVKMFLNLQLSDRYKQLL